MTVERVFSEHNEDISNDISSFMREEIILVLYVCFLKVNSSFCDAVSGFQSWDEFHVP